MNQAKNNNVDARSDKPDRRRVPTGRTAVLRRAPSDSDCSGETASLSADSGDRAIRPAPPPVRAAKSRSRRRGSEWEVLEGLKDGQRFEKRPDVFNGYLHKKRKWPLKGWHKRFFVVDGGILVYARSPADVARGRLHGSVDVGLSVISAKARRRRIDIDADEFIYHLRAKTPELFRTWLNVLKAHRLYRQHLLTFGVRESAPKIHAPSDDLPATDTSSHTSFTTSETTTVTSNDHQSTLTSPPINNNSSVYCHKADNSICNWQRKCISKSDLTPLNCESLEQKCFELKFDDAIYKNRSLCSMNCIARKFMSLRRKMLPGLSLNSTDAEQQMISTDLDLNSLKGTDLEASLIDKFSLMLNTQMPVNADKSNDIQNVEEKQSLFFNAKVPPTTACYFFTRKKRYVDKTESIMRKSKKCTNLVKYKNNSDEPPMQMPSSKCLLLGKYRLKASKHSSTANPPCRAIGCETLPKENDEVKVIKEHKASQNAMTGPDYDRITEKLIVSIFQNQTDRDDNSEMKYYIDRVVKDLYDIKIDQDMHPVKALFRCLLEYWLKNTSVYQFKEAMTSAKSIERQSNKYFTRDENLSSVFIHMISKETQFQGCDVKHKGNKNTDPRLIKCNKREKNYPSNEVRSPRRDTESFEKERRIQELERLLKNTVYICETQRNNKSREKDIKITKKLIDNLGKNSKKPDDCADKPILDKSVSSTELPEIQDTINQLITDTAIPPDFAKEFLGAYLDVLLHDESKSTSTTQSSDWSSQSRDIPVCQVQAESTIKKVSRSITTEKAFVDHNKSLENEKQIDSGEVYLKDVLDKITTIFSNVHKDKDKQTPKHVDYVPSATKDELGRPMKICSMKNFIYENCDEKSLVIDLSKYNLEHIAMFNDPAIKGIMSISIKLKEKPSNSGESKQAHLNLKFADKVKSIVTPMNKSENWMSLISDNIESGDIFNNMPKSMNQSYIDFEANKDLIDLKPYLSSSDATSKAYRFLNESDHSIDASIKNNDFTKDITANKKENDDPQSCYIMSFKKNALATKLQSKKKVKLKPNDGTVTTSKDQSPSRSPTRTRPEELTIFEKPIPRIIDEKFILLLLENLMQLSKNVPALFKDINCLYIKLRKKHDKVLKNCSNIQGLSLLGKIYNDESYVNGFNDKTTQIDSDLEIEVEKNTKENKNCSTNTIRNVADKEVDTSRLPEEPIIPEIIPKREDDTKVKLKLLNLDPTPNDSDEPKASSSNKERMVVTQTETVDIDSIDNATSIANWFNKITKDSAISTIIKHVFDNESSQNFRMTSAKPIRIEREQLKKKRHSPKTKQDLIKEISLLSPSFKVSTQSQTENQVLRIGMEKNNHDFNVYQLFLSQTYKLKGSSSMTVASVKSHKSNDMSTLYRCTSDPSNASGLISPTSPTLRGPQAGFVSGTPGGRLAGWIIESGGPLENATRELGQAQLSVQQLQRLLDALELQQQVHHDTDVSLEGASPNVKKDRRKFGLRKKKSNSKCASVELAPPHIDPSSSHTALSALTAPPSPGGGASSNPNLAASLPMACAAARPQSLPAAESMVTIQAGPASLTSLTPDHQLREDFTVLAKDLVASLKGVVSTLVCERSRLRAAVEAAESPAAAGSASMAALRTNLTSALHQNSELRSRLSRIHDASDIAEISDPSARAFAQTLSYSSSCVSASEFFDAEEHEDDDDDLKPEIVIPADEAGVIELDGDSSSEAGSLSSGEEGSASSENSEGAMLSAEAVTLRHDADADTTVSWTRRTRLPTPRPAPGGPSLWNLLYKNIGKDLSQISMPVTINEPLNMLQRLCEELEYSELLDSAAECKSSVERMAMIAAFAVSAYAASAHRAASKPFNPLLAETFECVRDDRGFRFLAEQVSHHPPISACHAESPRWCFWQEARIKTKFWGKSMEFQPTGRVHVRLNTTGDHYTWNKVTTCVHNLFGGQRWVDQYGDMHITCVGTDISCKLNFIKASSWSTSRHEVRGCISGGRGARLRLAGRWSEALYAGDPPAARCLWRPGAMPPEHELYYGFTRFAMELNELEPGMRERLPHTDTRLRPDQRALEEGLVDSAEQLKHDLEQSQRERRRDSTHHIPAWFRKVMEEGEETWVFSGEYWKTREAGFCDDAAPRIW